MTPREFAEFLVDAQIAFPTLGEFIASSPNPDATTDAWTNALSDCSVSDCRAAIDAMLRGDIEQPRYKWDGLPGIIRGFAKRRESDRTVPPEPEWKRPPVSNLRGDERIAPVVEEILKRVRERGESIQEAHRAIDPFRDAIDDPDKQPRYKCQWCHDSQNGYVLVWRHCIVVRFRDVYAEEMPRDWKADLYAWLRKHKQRLEFFDVIPCCCDSKAATAKRNRERREGEKVAEFNPDKMPVYRGESYREVDQLREWIAANYRALEFGAGVEWSY